MKPYSPRVSEVLALLYPGSLAFVPPEALERGSQAHEQMERWANDVLLGYAHKPTRLNSSVIEYLDRIKFSVTRVEFRLDSKMGYHGHLDALGEFRPTGERWILDYKFAEAITEANRMQVESYFRMAREHKLCDKAGLLQCRADGRVKLWRHKANTRLWHAFLSGVNVLRFQQQHRPHFQLDDIEPLPMENPLYGQRARDRAD